MQPSSIDSWISSSAILVRKVSFVVMTMDSETRRTNFKSCAGLKFSGLLAVVVLGYIVYEFSGKHDADRTLWSPSVRPSRVRVVLPADSEDLVREALSQVYQQMSASTDTLTEIINITEVVERKRRTKKACLTLEEPPEKKALTTVKRALYYENNKILYCSVPKAGSKFLKTFFSAVDDEAPSTGTVLHDKTGTKMGTLISERDPGQKKVKYMRRILKKSFKVMFSRDPYSRVFSSYIDKLLTPNKGYLKLARDIASVTRNKTDTRSGETVEFHELISYLLTLPPEEYNRHFKPVSLTCNVCTVEYDFLAKIETFKHDLQYIMSVTEAAGKITFRNFEEESHIEYIVFRTERTFSHLTYYEADFFISKHVGYLRLWRSFQIEGLIDIYTAYPLSEEESEYETLTSLCNVILDAYYRSSHSASANKQAALIQAYSTVPVKDMEKLRSVFLDDFTLFQYEDRPDFLFDRNAVNKPNQFDFFDVLSI